MSRADIGSIHSVSVEDFKQAKLRANPSWMLDDEVRKVLGPTKLHYGDPAKAKSNNLIFVTAFSPKEEPSIVYILFKTKGDIILRYANDGGTYEKEPAKYFISIVRKQQ